MPLVTKNLGLIQAIHAGLTPPTNILMLWYDQNIGVNIPKYYDVITSAWIPLISNGIASIFYQEFTYSQLNSLRTTNSLVPGRFYKVTDRGDLGIVIQAVSLNQLSLFGTGVFLNCDFQNLVLPTSNCISVGVWHSGLTGLLINKSVCFWNGLSYKSKSGNVGTQPDTDNINWTLLPKTSIAFYVQEVDFVIYNFENDIITYREDKRQNKISGNINVFQWGNDNVTGNINITSSAIISNINQRGIFISNVFEGATRYRSTNNNTGSLTFNKFNVRWIDINTDTILNLNTNINFSYNDLEFDGTINLIPNLTQAYKTCNKLGSNFEYELDMSNTVIYNTSRIIIPSNCNYIGIFILKSNSGVTISNIDFLPLHKCKFKPFVGETYTFDHISISSSPTTNALISDAAFDNVIFGRVSGSDFIEYEQSVLVVVRTNIVKLA